MYLEHKGPTEIGRALGMDPGTVRRRVRAIRAHWNKERLNNYDQVVNQFTATAERVMELAFRGYKASLQASSETIERESEFDSAAGGSGTNSSIERREKKAGDPRFLELALRCNYQIGQVHGLLDRDPRDSAPNADQRSALIEVVVTTRADVANLRQLSFEQLQRLAPVGEVLDATVIAK